MCVNRWKKSFLLILFFSLQLNAYMINSKQLSSDKLYIQVGAFLQQKSVEAIQKKLHRFPLWLGKKGSITKVYVVSNPKYKKAMFRKVKKLIPDAFIIKNKKNIFLSPSNTKILTSQSPKMNQKDLTLPLNTKTILQTRKKFF